MDATTDLSSLLEATHWTGEAVAQLRRTAFETSKQVEQLRGWAAKAAGQDDRSASLKAGIALFLLGQYDQSAEQLKAASEGELKRYYLALALRELGQYDAALAELERAADRGWNAFDIAMQTAETLRRAGRLDEADKLLTRHARAGEKVADWHFQKGAVLEYQGDGEAALTALAKALDLDADHQGACFHMAYVRLVEGKDEDAINLYKRCIQTPPAPMNALINLAILYEDLGAYNLAIRCLQEVLRIDPNHPRARLYRKDALAGLTQYYDEAQERLRDKRTAVLEIPITDFELSVRSRNCLKKMNIHTLGDLLRVSETELLGYKNFGETSLNEIRAVLAQKGLRLGQAVEEERAIARRTAAKLAAAVGGEDVLAKSVDELELSVRSRRCLERLGLRTLGDLASRTEAELLAAKNFGVTSLNEIKQQMAHLGLGLRKLDE